MKTNQFSGVIAVFGSHAPQPGSYDYEAAREVGRLLAEAGYAVMTGGYGGVMAAASQGAAEVGGHVIGVTSSQVAKSRPVKLNRWVVEEICYETLIDRVEHLVKQNQGMIVMPGGIGTLSELALGWSLMQVKEITPRPLILLGKIWAEMMDVFIHPEYISGVNQDMIHLVCTPAEAVDLLSELSTQVR